MDQFYGGRARSRIVEAWRNGTELWRNDVLLKNGNLRCKKIRLLWNNTFELEEIVWCRGGRQVAAQENQRKKGIKWTSNDFVRKWAYPKNRIEMLDENGEITTLW